MLRDSFISAIDSIRSQSLIDYDNSVQLSDFFGCSVPVYDNSLLIKSLRGLLSSFFIDSDSVSSEIDHYCFFQNFGRVEVDGEILLESSGDFYDRLVRDYKLRF